MEHLSKKINWHHAAMQGAFWAGMSALWGYLSVYLLAKGFSNGQIGFINSLSLILSIVFQPMLAALSDRSSRFNSRRIAILLTLFTLAVTGLLYCFDNSFWMIAVCFVLIGTVIQLLAPFINAIVMEYDLHGIPVNYGFGRGIGSAFYAAASLGMGLVLEHHAPIVLLPVFAALYGLLLFSFLTFRYPLPSLPEAAELKEEEQLSTLQILKSYPTFVLLLIACALLMASHNTVNTYFIHLVRSIGHGESLMGIVIAICAFMELPSMTLFPFFKSRLSIRALLRIAALGFLAKTLLLTVAQTPTLMYIAATLQFFEFGILHPAMVYYTARLLSIANLAKGQSLYCVFSNCVGPAAASLLGGFLLDRFGVTAMMLFLLSCCIAGLIIICIATRRKNDLEVTV